MKQGSFPGCGYVVRSFSGTMNPSDSLSAAVNFAVGLYGGFPMQGRVSPVPYHTFVTCRFLYTEGFFDGVVLNTSKFFPSSVAFIQKTRIRLPLVTLLHFDPSME